MICEPYLLMFAAMYANVKRLLQTAERTNCVRLPSLALRPLHFRPVVRALQFQASLKELELPGNPALVRTLLTCETVLSTLDPRYNVVIRRRRPYRVITRTALY